MADGTSMPSDMEEEDRASQRKAKPRRSRSNKKSSKRRNKGLVSKLTRQYDDLSSQSENVPVPENKPVPVPGKSILKTRIGGRLVPGRVTVDGEMPSTSQAMAPYKSRSRTDEGYRRRTSFHEEAKRESTDDGMDEIDALVCMLAKFDYYLPDDLDWRVPRSQLLRMQISVRLQLDLRYLRFIHRWAPELDRPSQRAIDNRASGETDGFMDRTVVCVDEERNEVRYAYLDELNGRLQLLELESPEEYASAASSYETCASIDAMAGSSCDSLQMIAMSRNPAIITSISRARSTDGMNTEADATCDSIPTVRSKNPATISSIDADTESTATEEDGGSHSSQDRPPKRPWWRRLLSAISCCKDDSTEPDSNSINNFAQTSTTDSKTKESEVRRKDSSDRCDHIRKYRRSKYRGYKTPFSRC